MGLESVQRHNTLNLRGAAMSKIIQLHDYFDSDISFTTHDLLPDAHDAILLENHQLLAEVMKLEEQSESLHILNVNLRGQVKESQVENETLLQALMDEMKEPSIDAPLLLEVVNVVETLKEEKTESAAAMPAYWEKEYSVLKDKIRQMEVALEAKEKALANANVQTEKLLNELLAKS